MKRNLFLSAAAIVSIMTGLTLATPVVNDGHLEKRCGSIDGMCS